MCGSMSFIAMGISPVICCQIPHIAQEAGRITSTINSMISLQLPFNLWMVNHR